MKKWLHVLGVVSALFAVLLLFRLFALGPIIKTAVNTKGSEITGTDLHVEGVSASILSGEVVLKGLVVKNPLGFKAAEAVHASSVHVDVDLKTLTDRTIVIKRVEVVEPVITYERNKTSDNLQAILDNVKQTTGGGGRRTSETTSAASSGKKILIRDFVLKNGKVSLYLMAGRSVTARIPEIRMKNIGGQKDGTTPARTVREMLSAVWKRVQSPEVLGVYNEQLENVKTHLNDLDLKSLPGKLDRKAGSVADKLKGLFRDH